MTPSIFGHRGARASDRGHQAAPAVTENTLAAFRRAAEQHADGIELDVRPCRSGELIVLHDPDLERVTKGRDRRRACALSLAEITSVDLGGGEPVPSLEQVLAWAAARQLRVNIELKRDVPSRTAAVRTLAEELRRHGRPRHEVWVSSFDPLMLAGLRALLPTLPCGLLFGREQLKYRPLAVARAFGFFALHPERSLVTAALVDAAHARGQRVNVWTVNEATEARALAALGVDALITDRPGELRAALGSASVPA